MMDNTEEINKLTHKIIGCAMEIHNQLGNGFQSGRRAEVIYQRSLVIEFQLQDLEFARELEMELRYKGEFVGTRRVDFENEFKATLETILNE